MPNSSADRNPVERLAEQFLERQRRGEHPLVSEYIARHPEWASEIRQLFPALALMERLKPVDGDVTGSFLNGFPSQPGQIPQHLGDFRILREVGRGGMGIVFEAEQESLGRHVALKVLPSNALLNPRHLERFRREAKVAARLHHTNIVPVYGVGESDGLHYYAMQFITGSGLHEIVDELRGLKSIEAKAAEHQLEPQPFPSVTSQLKGLAQGLLTGRYTTTLADPNATTDSSLNSESTVPPSSDVLARSVILSGTGRDFAKEVARVGLQVASALAYAHDHGVLHRDIKPSNLLLDIQGAVWVADFGLAKAINDGDDLTNEGDLLGTLRYMAPERFRGQSDARSDLYALGLTLYELLTLRPAFDQTDRDRLILQVTNELPTRPRAINPEIPRDLETIILKVMEHEPARRYQDAEAMVDDLERFLADRPIRARPVGALERLGKWARRKPAIAALVAALATALVVGFTGVSWQWREAVGARNTAQQNEARAETNLRHALETVDRFCTQVSEEELLEQPRMLPLRRRLLGLALEYYQAFQRQQGDDPKLLFDLSQTFQHSGILARELGDATKAHLLLLRAFDILNELRRSAPDNLELRLQLTRCCLDIEEVNILNNSSYVYYSSTNPSSPKLPAQLMMEPLVAADPENPEYLRLLGRAYGVIGMGGFGYRRGSFPYAREWMRKAIAMLDRARAADPLDVETARWLALSLADLGFVYEQTGEQIERVVTLSRAVAILKEVEGRTSRPRRDRFERGQVVVQLGLALADIGRFEESVTRLREANEDLASLLEENPEAFEVRYWMALGCQGQARAALARGQGTAPAIFAEAAELLERIPAESRTARDLLALAWTYVWLGESKFQNGKLEVEERERLRKQLADVLKAHDQRSNFASITYPEQARRSAQVAARVNLVFATASAADTHDQIALQRQESRERSRIAEKQRDNPALQLEAALALIRLAEWLLRDGSADEARSLLNEAFKMLGDPSRDDLENLRLRHCRARAWETLARLQFRSRQTAEAIDSAGQAVAIVEGLLRIDPTYFYDLSCMIGLRGMVSSSETDSAAAIAALRRAIETGFDNDSLLRADPRLDALRSRPDFPILVRVPERK